MDLLPRVRDYIRRHGLLTPGDGVVIGVSGGPDSLCLLHLFRRLQEEMELRLHVVHLHHGARGSAADADAAFVADLARQWELPVTVARHDVPAIARELKMAFEEAARRVRYGLLVQTAGEVGATRVAVGHNADDQSETVLMHFLRGAGPSGLRGMLPATAFSTYRLLDELPFSLPSPLPTLVRPLLEIPRADIERYCQAQGLEPRFDRSNLDTTFFRNRLRHELLPLLETYNPNIHRRLQHTAEIIRADWDLLIQLRDAAWKDVVRQETEAVILLDRAAWQAQPQALQRALVREAVYRLRRQLRDVSFVHVENAVRIAQQGKTGTQAVLPQGLALTVGYDYLLIAAADTVLSLDGPVLAATQEIAVQLPGRTGLPDGQVILEATLQESWMEETVVENPDRWTAYLDADALHPPIILRTRRPGDRFRPQGMGGHAPRLTDWMTNAKIPRSWRDRLPLLVADQEIVWVCGWRISETARVGPATRRLARFCFQKTN